MNSIGQQIQDEYLQITKKMLSLGKLRICDVYPTVRIIRVELYETALKASNKISKQRFWEDINLLLQDIHECDKRLLNDRISYENKQALINILRRFLKQNRFSGDKDVKLFRESFEKEIL